ncbi:hypothetical protein [Pelagibacterium lentulum]|uniref:Uncharacterized protein n=1 Tax=Pelagibacterium lentulum TaxID=2029865 RepID=A0A916R908_9HYPH|nr:hypothetical protein [Pelagibacterium lentulum]GGA42050.1 hypothetical protein GCM10011499_09670 [Pelagibacterium lentulum]
MTEINHYVEQLLRDSEEQYQTWLNATAAEELSRYEPTGSNDGIADPHRKEPDANDQRESY